MIIRQKIIKREDLQANPDFMYLFGDNLVRKGLGGQAGEMRGEPNAIGIATKKYPNNDPLSFFYDDQYMENVAAIYEDIMPAMQHLMNGGVLVIPMDGLGTGLSALPLHAPRTNKALEDLISYLYDVDERFNGPDEDED